MECTCGAAVFLKTLVKTNNKLKVTGIELLVVVFIGVPEKNWMQYFFTYPRRKALARLLATFKARLAIFRSNNHESLPSLRVYWRPKSKETK